MINKTDISLKQCFYYHGRQSAISILLYAFFKDTLCAQESSKKKKSLNSLLFINIGNVAEDCISHLIYINAHLLINVYSFFQMYFFLKRFFFGSEDRFVTSKYILNIRLVGQFLKLYGQRYCMMEFLMCSTSEREYRTYVMFKFRNRKFPCKFLL